LVTFRGHADRRDRQRHSAFTPAFKAELLALNTLGPTNSTVHPFANQLVEVYAQVVKSLLMQTPAQLQPTVTAIMPTARQ
jgi:hypothetical protein